MTTFTHPPRILFLYSSLREYSYSRLLTEEAARIIAGFGDYQQHCTFGIGWNLDCF